MAGISFRKNLLFFILIHLAAILALQPSASNVTRTGPSRTNALAIHFRPRSGGVVMKDRVTFIEILSTGLSQVPDSNNDQEDSRWCLSISSSKHVTAWIEPARSVFCFNMTFQLDRTHTHDAGTKYSGDGEVIGKVYLRGTRVGHTSVTWRIFKHFDSDLSVDGIQEHNYDVTVVQQFDLLEDLLFYLMFSGELLTLTFVCSRLRLNVVKNELRGYRGLLSSLIISCLIVTFASIGCCLIIDLSIHSTVGLLLVGCSPASLLSSIFVVLQQGQVEMAVLSTAFQSMAAVGLIPLWCWVYSLFFPLPFSLIAMPFWYLAAANVAASVLPLTLGLALQHICSTRPSVTSLLSAIDPVIHTTCLVLTLSAGIVNCGWLWTSWELVVWEDLAAVGLTTAVGGVSAAVVCSILHQNLSQTKAIFTSSTLQNSTLAMALVFRLYPAPDASLMFVSIVSGQLVRLIVHYVLGVVHMVTWIADRNYRSMHDGSLRYGPISGIYRSIADRFVKAMVRAGEITFRSKMDHDRSAIAASGSCSPCPSPTDSNSKPTTGFCGISFGSRVLVASLDSMTLGLTQQHKTTSAATSSANNSDNKRQALESAGPAANRTSGLLGRSSPSPVEQFSFSLFAMDDDDKQRLKMSPDESRSLSIDYEMLTAHGAAASGAERDGSGMASTNFGFVRENSGRASSSPVNGRRLFIFDELFTPFNNNSETSYL